MVKIFIEIKNTPVTIDWWRIFTNTRETGRGCSWLFVTGLGLWKSDQFLWLLKRLNSPTSFNLKITNFSFRQLKKNLITVYTRLWAGPLLGLNVKKKLCLKGYLIRKTNHTKCRLVVVSLEWKWPWPWRLVTSFETQTLSYYSKSCLKLSFG